MKVVSANSGEKTPHFLFCVDEINRQQKLLVKIIAEKADLSIERELAAFEIMNATMQPRTGFHTPEFMVMAIPFPCIVLY